MLEFCNIVMLGRVWWVMRVCGFIDMIKGGFDMFVGFGFCVN